MRKQKIIFNIICMCQIFFILAQSARYTSVVFSYQINKEFVSKYLCEKKEQSNNNCHGKCYLAKKLHEEDTSSSAAIPLKEAGEEVIWNFNHHEITFFLESKNVIFQSFYSRLNAGFERTLFRPPSLV